MSASYTVGGLAEIARRNHTYGAEVKAYLHSTGLYDSVVAATRKSVHEWDTHHDGIRESFENFLALFECISANNKDVWGNMPLVRRIELHPYAASRRECERMFCVRSPGDARRPTARMTGRARRAASRTRPRGDPCGCVF